MARTPQTRRMHTPAAQPRHARPRLRNSRKWARESEAFLTRYPFCVLCLSRGKVNEGATQHALETQRNLVVDHIAPHKDDLDLFWDILNWQTLCRYPCHDKAKRHFDLTDGTRDGWFQLLREQPGTNLLSEANTPEHIMWGVSW